MPAWRPRLALACLALAIRWRPDFVSFKGHRGQRGHVARAAKGYGVLRKLLQLQEEFLSLPKTKDRDAALLDVRSPKEFAQGHVPGAQSLPLLNDDERPAQRPDTKRPANSSSTAREVACAHSPWQSCCRGMALRLEKHLLVMFVDGQQHTAVIHLHAQPTLRWSDGDVWLLK
eukprot:g3252.t1